MSVSGVSSSSLFDFNSPSVQNRIRQFRQEFQQLGQDLQSGNLSAAQTDFAALQQSGPQTNSTSSTQSSNPLVQDFKQLSQDLQSGNLTPAQQEYTKIRQDFQSQAQSAHGHHHHGGGGGGASAISQLLQQLGQELQSGSLASAQQAYSALQQEFPQRSQSNSLLQTSPPSSSGVSVNA